MKFANEMRSKFSGLTQFFQPLLGTASVKKVAGFVAISCNGFIAFRVLCALVCCGCSCLFSLTVGWVLCEAVLVVSAESTKPLSSAGARPSASGSSSQQPWQATSPSLVGVMYRGSDGAMTCALCNCEMEWEECHGFDCEDGYYDGYDDDPIFYDRGDMVPCPECNGRGGSWWCTTKDCPTKEGWKTIPAPQPKKV